MKSILEFKDYQYNVFESTSVPVFESLESYLLREDNKWFLEKNAKLTLVDSIIETKIFGEKETFLLEVLREYDSVEYLFENELNEGIYEGLKDIIKDKVEKTKDKFKTAAGDVKDKAKEELDKLKNIGGSLKGLISLVLKSIGDFLKKAWDYIYNTVKKRYEPAKKFILEKTKKIKTSTLGVEVKDLKNLTNYCSKYFTKGVVGDMNKALTRSAKDVDESLDFESLIEKSLYLSLSDLLKEDKEWWLNEYKKLEKFDLKIFEEEHESHDAVKIPFLSKLIHKVNEYPPFSWLAQLTHFLGEKSAKWITKFHEGINKFFGGPGLSEDHEYKSTGTIMGLVGEYGAKAGLKTGVKKIASVIGAAAVGSTVAVALPAIGTILLVLKKTAQGIWYYEMGQEILKVIGVGKNDQKDKDKEENEE